MASTPDPTVSASQFAGQASASASSSSGERAVVGSGSHDDDRAKHADDAQEMTGSEDAERSTSMDVAAPERVDAAGDSNKAWT